MLSQELDGDLKACFVIFWKKSQIMDANQKIRFMSLYRLFDTFVHEYPQYRDLAVALADINNVLNAAAHAQRIPESQAETTLDIASDLIATIESIKQEMPGSWDRYFQKDESHFAGTA